MFKNFKYVKYALGYNATCSSMVMMMMMIYTYNVVNKVVISGHKDTRHCNHHLINYIHIFYSSNN